MAAGYHVRTCPLSRWPLRAAAHQPPTCPSPQRRSITIRATVTLAAGLAALAAHAQTSPCRGIVDNAQRLACYDRAATQAEAVPAPAAALAPTPAPLAALPGTRSAPATSNLSAADTPAADQPAALAISLVDRWELSPEHARGRFLIRPYKPVYVLPVVLTTVVNHRPSSPNPANNVSEFIPWRATEAKFQLSLKTKLFEGLFGGQGDVWGGYTQSSRWQVYNGALSRPFRETNYEPEGMLVFATDYPVLGLRGKLLGLSLNHQSNGRGNPLSRSWNRLIGLVGLEQGNWSLMLRPWWRVPENAGADNNADIGNYLGRAEAVLTHHWGGQIISLQLRHSLRSGGNARGSGQMDWAFPISGNLHGHLQAFSGYGESLIDYNFKQTRLGLGVSLVEWR